VVVPPRALYLHNPSSGAAVAGAAAMRPLSLRIAWVPVAAVATMCHIANQLVAPLAPVVLCHAVCFYLALVADYLEWRVPAIDAIPTAGLLGLPAVAAFAAAALIEALLVVVEGVDVRRARGGS